MSDRDCLRRQIDMLSKIIADDLAALHSPTRSEHEKKLLRLAVAQRSVHLDELKLRLADLEQSG